jgi:hypothetical protein
MLIAYCPFNGKSSHTLLMTSLLQTALPLSRGQIKSRFNLNSDLTPFDIRFEPNKIRFESLVIRFDISAILI